MLCRTVFYFSFFFINLNVFADELVHTFLKVPFGITLSELNNAIKTRNDILFLDTENRVINGNLVFDHWANSNEELLLKKKHSGANRLIIGNDTLGEIRFSFYSDKLYKITLDGSSNEKLLSDYFTKLLGKPKVNKVRVKELEYTYEVKKWLKNGMKIEFTFQYPSYPIVIISENDTDKSLNTLEESLRNFDINGVIESYQYPSGKVKDSVLEWQYYNEKVKSISSECLPFKYFTLRGNLKDFSVVLKCQSTGEVIYREDNLTLNRKMRVFEDLNIWLDYCVDSEENGRFSIEVIKDNYTVFHGLITRNACYE